MEKLSEQLESERGEKMDILSEKEKIEMENNNKMEKFNAENIELSSKLKQAQQEASLFEGEGQFESLRDSKLRTILANQATEKGSLIQSSYGKDVELVNEDGECVWKLIAKFKETGSIADKLRRRPSITSTNDKASISMSARFTVSPSPPGSHFEPRSVKQGSPQEENPPHFETSYLVIETKCNSSRI
ncbi:hypothetical protein Avbf_09014 [Armadillidium vulgare]|nr:hypothetical protein Avbf_09014 [Armadillidium vulgare]